MEGATSAGLYTQGSQDIQQLKVPDETVFLKEFL
jgi:hypothetical protein